MCSETTAWRCVKTRQQKGRVKTPRGGKEERNEAKQGLGAARRSGVPVGIQSRQKHRRHSNREGVSGS